MVFYNIISSKLASIKKVDEVIAILKVSPKTFKKYHLNSEIHQIEILKQITLFYQINGNNVELLLFFNNYQDPNNLKKLLK